MNNFLKERLVKDQDLYMVIRAILGLVLFLSCLFQLINSMPKMVITIDHISFGLWLFCFMLYGAMSLLHSEWPGFNISAFSSFVGWLCLLALKNIGVWHSSQEQLIRASDPQFLVALVVTALIAIDAIQIKIMNKYAN